MFFGLYLGALGSNDLQGWAKPKRAYFAAPLGAFEDFLVLENQEVDGLHGYTIGFHGHFDFNLGFAEVGLGPVFARWVDKFTYVPNKHEYLVCLGVFARN